MPASGIHVGTVLNRRYKLFTFGNLAFVNNVTCVIVFQIECQLSPRRFTWESWPIWLNLLLLDTSFFTYFFISPLLSMLFHICLFILSTPLSCYRGSSIIQSFKTPKQMPDKQFSLKKICLENKTNKYTVVHWSRLCRV